MASIHQYLSISVIFALLITIIIAKCYDCSPMQHKDEITRFKRYKNVSEAINCLHKGLIDQSMPHKARCKRYAVLLAMSAAKGVPYEATVKQLSTIHEDTINEFIQNIDDKRLSSLFMAAIDRYRISELEPPFIELLECLRQIDSPPVHLYSNDRELNLIEKLYRQILKSPDIKIDLSQLHTDDLRPAFLSSLRHIFIDNLKDGPGTAVPEALSENQEGTSSNAQGSNHLPDTAMTEHTQPQPVDQGWMTEEQRHELQSKRRRYRERQRGRNIQGDDWRQYREGERLRQRRLRLLESDALNGRIKQHRLRRPCQQQLLDEQIEQYFQRESQDQRLAVGQYFTDPQATDCLTGQQWGEERELAQALEPSHAPRVNIEPQRSEHVTAIQDISSRLPVLGASSSNFQQSAQPSENRQSVLDAFDTPSYKRPQDQQQSIQQQPLVRLQFSNNSHQATSPSYDQTLHLPGDGDQQLIGNYVQYDSPAVHSTDLQRLLQAYSYVAEKGTTKDARSPSVGGFTPESPIFDLGDNQLDSIDELLNFSDQLDDFDEVIQSFSNPTTPAPETTRHTLALSGVDLGDPWEDFDRQFSRRKEH